MTQRKAKSDLYSMLLKEVSLVDAGANPHADILLMKRKEAEVSKATKTEGGQKLPASAYAYVPDANSPSTWKLRIDDLRHVAGSIAALGPGGFRGQKVTIPANAVASVKAKVREAWLKFNPDKTVADVPPPIRKSLGDALSEVRWPLDVFEQLEEEIGKAEEAAQSFDEVVTERTVRREMWQLMDALSESVGSILEDDTVTDKGSAVKDSLSQFVDAMSTMMVGKSDREGKTMSLTKAELEEKVVELEKKQEETTAALEKANEELKASTEANSALKKSAEELQKSLDEVKKSGGKEKEEEVGINKADLSPEVRKYLEAQEKEAEELRKDANETKETVAKMRDEADTREVIEKVRADYSHLPGKEEEVVKSVKALRGTEGWNVIDTMLKAADTAIAKGTTEIGKGGQRDEEDDSALAELEKKAGEIAKRDGVTKEMAFTKALDEYPELAQREMQERLQTH